MYFKSRMLLALGVALFCILLVAQSLPAQEQQSANKPGVSNFVLEDIGGRIAGLAITDDHALSFYADYSIRDQVQISYQLPNQHLTVSIDLSARTADFLGLSSTGEIVSMHPEDKKALKSMLYLLQLHSGSIVEMKDAVNGKALQLLAKTTELLSMYDTGRELHVTITAPMTKGWVSLCSAIGTSKTAYWDNDTQTRFQSFIVGGHGVCKGRCGAGCPWFADPAYTQDCLNHDACAGEEGEQLGVCGDEWTAASDDFLFAPDCT